MKRLAYGIAVAGLLGGCSAADDGVDALDEPGTSTSGAGATTRTEPGNATDETTSGDSSEADDGDDDVEPDSEAGMPDLPPVEPPANPDCDALLELVDSLQNDPVDGDAEIDAFFRDVAYGELGFPMVDEQRLCFAYRDAVGLPLSVAGDFNDWVVGEHDLDYAAPQFDLRYAIVDGPSNGGDGLYKYVRMRDDPEYFADPAARRFGWDEFGEYSRIGIDAALSHYERWPDFDKGAGDLLPRDIVVYMPAGAAEEADLPVLYMHDGQNLFAPDALFGGWRVGTTMDFAIADGSTKMALVVGIDNTENRFVEYTHVADDLGGQLVGGGAADYADFVADAIKPFIDDRYPTSTLPNHTAVAGSSLGGLVSLYIGWRRPDVFGAAASMSGTVGWGSFGSGAPTLADLFGDAPSGGLRIYLDSGGGPGTGCPGGGWDNYCDNVALADTLRDSGWEDEVDLLYVWEADGMHNEAEWAERFPAMISNWFPGNL